MKKKLLFIHGRGPQPDADGLRKLLLQAIKIGVGREAPKQLAQLDNLQTELFYFADRNQQQIDRANTQHLRQQQEVLALLAEREKRRDFRRRHYDELPGKSALGEFAMDLAASAGLGGMAMRKVAPALEQYWHDDNFANTLNLDLQSWLLENVRSADKILLVSHCVGSVFVYDCLAQSQLQLGTWITLTYQTTEDKFRIVCLVLSKQSNLAPITYYIALKFTTNECHIPNKTSILTSTKNSSIC